MFDSKKLEFVAYDPINLKYYYSKDYFNLTTFFACFDCDKFTISPVNNTTVSVNNYAQFIQSTLDNIESLSRTELLHILNKMIVNHLLIEQVEYIAEIAENISNESTYQEYINDNNL